MPPVSPRCTEEPLVEPFRTAVRAEMAKSGLLIHPLPTVGVMNPSWVWLWLRVGVTEKRFVKMNYRVRNRNATTPPGGPTLANLVRPWSVSAHIWLYPAIAG